MNLNFINFKSLHQVNFDDSQLYKHVKDIYLGPKVSIVINSGILNDEEVNEFKRNCKEFYIILSKQIIKRINFEDLGLVRIKFITGIDYFSQLSRKRTKVARFKE